MEALHTSETSVDNHFTQQYNPEDNSEHYMSPATLNKLKHGEQNVISDLLVSGYSLYK
jgi:hypothetical protein